MGDSKEISLSVEETNELRAKLGLKPLRVDDGPKEGEAAAPGTSSLANDVLIEPVLPGEKRKLEELRRKLEDKRERRKIEKKLKEVKSLGEVDDEDDSAAAWAKKFKKIQKQKKLAAAREQALAEEDDAVEQAAEYGTADLAGLQVLHDKDLLQEGTTILTLADTGVLDDEDDKLENVEISAEERRHENEEKRKKGLDEYKGYDDDEFSDPSKARGAPNLLKKYDNIDVITGDEKKGERTGFSLDAAGGADLTREREAAAIREKLKEKELSLDYEVKVGGTDFYTTEEMAKFKKKKKKVKKSKVKALTADDLEMLPDVDQTTDRGSRKRKRTRGSDAAAAAAPTGGAAAAVAAMTGQSVAAVTGTADQADKAVSKPRQRTTLDLDALGEEGEEEDNMDLDLADVPVDDAEVAAEEEMAVALERARKLARAKKKAKATGADRAAQAIAASKAAADDNDAGGGAAETPGSITLTSMAEFVRIVGKGKDEAASAAAASAKEAAPAADTADDDAMEISAESGDPSTGWKAPPEGEAEVEDEEAEGEGITHEETVGKGIMAAVNFSKLRGFLDEGTRVERVGGVYHHPDRAVDTSATTVKAKSDSRDRRDRNDPFTLANYQPKVKLEYADDSGRVMTDKKEVFRYMSHKFHGKSSGKGKTEKRMQKLAETELSRKMESGDTPLGLTETMRRRMAESGSAHIVMGGDSTKKRKKKKN
eukprot:m.387605 g.387605  ORF g.387605 m.387605 type:complete len:711 (+) comp16751_c1_seq24:6253-8385(+)